MEAGLLKKIFRWFLLSKYEIWKVLVSLAKITAHFHVLGLFIPKKLI
jgi:hypothetical protein